MRTVRALRPTTTLAVLALALGACGGRGDDGTAVGAVPAAVYQVRGEVESLPDADRPMDWIALRHEAIPDFIGLTGDPDPMPAMTMRFPVADGVDVSSVSAGDKVAFDLEIDWGSGDPARVLAITLLPAETELDFGGGGSGGDHADH